MKRLTTFSAILLFALSASAKDKLTSIEYIDQWKITAIEQMNEHVLENRELFVEFCKGNGLDINFHKSAF